MPQPTNIRRYGNQLVMTSDDGSQQAFLSANGLYLPAEYQSSVPTPPSGGGNGYTVVSPLPTSISGTTTDGDVFNLNTTQILRAAQSISEALTITGMTKDALVVMLITELDESTLRNLSNVTHYPETATYPDIDGDGDDSDSVGLFQQRPSVPWGTPLQCCTITYEVDAFFGGPTGPNGGSPQGLFDLSPSWTTYSSPGAAAQAVQGSAFADPYDRFVPVANAILNALLISTGPGPSGSLPPVGTANTVNSDQVYAYMQANPTNIVGYCLQYWDSGARRASTMGNLDAGLLPTANAARGLTPGISQSNIPDAGFVWFDDPDGDVGFIYKGTCYFTDGAGNGVVGSLTVAQRLANLQSLHGSNAASFVGYSDNYLGYQFTEPS